MTVLLHLPRFAGILGNDGHARSKKRASVSRGEAVAPFRSGFVTESVDHYR